MSKNKTQKAEVQGGFDDNPLNLPLIPIYKPIPVISTPVSKSGTWITDRAWICGVAGALAVALCAWWFNATGALESGIFLFDYQITTTRHDTLLAALFIISGVMLCFEWIRLWKWEGSEFFNLAPDLKQKRYSHFLGNCLINYFLNLSLLWLVILVFHTAGEYGFRNQSAYYQPWFRFLEIVWNAYLVGGFAYVVLTRALKHSPEADRREIIVPLGKAFGWIASRLLRAPSLRPAFDHYDKKAVRALLVKVFFTPLMTVFFCDQFPHFVNNVGYLFHGLPEAIANNSYTHHQFNQDFFHISIAIIFSVDVALAWCGYVVSSRWVDNQTASAEPTMLGWVVCLVCYPPFQMFLGLYYGSPGEHEILTLFENQSLITFYTAMMVTSYMVYMSATLWFGVRFSNMTNRGIIRKGPFAFIRHPAYASKNFSWWIVMFPVVIYNGFHADMEIALLQTMGLILMTFDYYMRAMTEERHLSLDPVYMEYCKQVPYRFIPGVI
jgi:protein-S-isoprenylcysteine O-methyltransferase Ste14